MRKLLLGLIGLLFAIPVFAACPTGQIEQTYTSATGTVTQNGTPTPTNPIEPIFYQQGDMILRKVGDVADSYDAATGKITRRVGVKVLDGTEDWYWSNPLTNMFCIYSIKEPTTDRSVLCNQFRTQSTVPSTRDGYCVKSAEGYIGIGYDTLNGDITAFKAYLADQYTAGTPVTVYYPLKAENYYTEDWAAEQCTSSSPIKIATTAYNSARFSPVVTELNDTIATIRSVVTNTINQTKAIADLQATKQTRPDETCPAGKKCLLVEDNDGQPHWYEIIENAYGLPNGYTALEYIQSRGAQYINTGIYATQNTAIETRFINLSGESTTSVLIGNGWTGGKYQLSIVAQTGAPNRIGGLTNSLQSFWTTNTDFVVSMNKNGLYVNNSLKAWSGTLTEFTSTNPLYLLGDPTASGRYTYAKLFYMKIYNNDTLVRDLIPAKRNSDSVLGMYDLANDVFYTNAGSGTFTAGPVVQ